MYRYIYSYIIFIYNLVMRVMRTDTNGPSAPYIMCREASDMMTGSVLLCLWWNYRDATPPVVGASRITTRLADNKPLILLWNLDINATLYHHRISQTEMTKRSLPFYFFN